MSQERLDQRTRLPLGTRDVVHLPVISAQFDRSPGDYTFYDKLKPGAYVKFTDDKFTKFILCEYDEAHGFINPCLTEINCYDNVLIFMLPSVTHSVRHHFEIDLNKKQLEKELLEAELASVREEDSDCGNCWVIRNNEIIRM